MNRTIVNADFLRNLLLLLIGLKLSGFIDWSWIAVLMPFWLTMCVNTICSWWLNMAESKRKENHGKW